MAESIVSGAPVQARYGREVKTLVTPGASSAASTRRGSSRRRSSALGLVRALLGDFAGATAWPSPRCSSIYPFGEWAIHVYLLHLRPFGSAGRRVDLATAQAHREHHEAPNDLGLILLARSRRRPCCSSPCRRSPRWRPLVAALLPGRCRGRAPDRGADRLRPGRPLRVDALPDPHRLPAALALLPLDLAHPPPPPLQERALLARDHNTVGDRAARAPIRDQRDVPRSRDGANAGCRCLVSRPAASPCMPA